MSYRQGKQNILLFGYGVRVIGNSSLITPSFGYVPIFHALSDSLVKVYRLLIH